MIIFGGDPGPVPAAQIPGYIGPRETYERYMRGEVVTRTDALRDESEFIMVPGSEFSNRDRDRLWWMVEHLETVDGKPERRAQLSSRDETNNTVVSQTVTDHPNIAHSAVPTPGIAITDRRRPCLK